jgi:processive 1,2-diacylglycerol beta-glucosyltransferase
LGSKTIWILYSSRKGGHAYPSRSIHSYLTGKEKEYCSHIINTLDLSWVLSFMDTLGRVGDLKLRTIYRTGYRSLQEDSRIMKGVYRFVEHIIYDYSKVRHKLIRAYGRPDIVISIQPEINAVAHLFKSWFVVPFHTVIIDLAVHGLWINDCIDKYYVPTEPLRREIVSYGVPADRVMVAGMPLRSGFSTVVKTSVSTTKKKLGLSRDLQTVLLIGGLLGKMLDFEGLIKSIAEMQMPIQILAVFGENELARRHAMALKHHYKYPMHLYRTVTNMHELMWASDVVISKPGSVTMAEVLSLGKPLIAINPLAGSAQELRFARFLEENDAGTWINDPTELGAALKNIIGCQDRYRQMSKNARALGRYGLTANKTICENIRRTLENREVR